MEIFTVHTPGRSFRVKPQSTPWWKSGEDKSTIRLNATQLIEIVEGNVPGKVVVGPGGFVNFNTTLNSALLTTKRTREEIEGELDARELWFKKY